MRSAALCLFLFAALIPAEAAESAQTDQWTRVVSPHFELFTTAGEQTGRDAVQHFEKVRAFFEQASPVKFPSEFPARIIIFKNREQYQAYSPNAITIAYYTAGPQRDYIIMSEASPESYTLAVHEYLHLVVRRSGLRIPEWLNEGLADVYSTFRQVRDGIAVGDLLSNRMKDLDAEWLTFQVLTDPVASSAASKDPARAGIFYAESWALAHMLFLAPEYSSRFPQFVTALNQGKTSAEACESAFGRSSDKVFEDLRNYFKRKKIYGTVFKTAIAKPDAQPAASRVTEFESRLVLADLLVALRKLEEAKREYTLLDQQQPDRGDVLQSLGYVAVLSHDVPSAISYFEKAFAAGDADPQMCFQLAMFEREAKQPPEKIIPVLERAVRSRPDYIDAVVQLGLTRIAARQFEAAIDTLTSIPNVTPQYAPPLFSGLVSY